MAASGALGSVVQGVGLEGRQARLVTLATRGAHLALAAATAGAAAAVVAALLPVAARNAGRAIQLEIRLLGVASFSSLDELRERLLAFIDYFNAAVAKPFGWTYAGKPLQK